MYVKKKRSSRLILTRISNVFSIGGISRCPLWDGWFLLAVEFVCFFVC